MARFELAADEAPIILVARCEIVSEDFGIEAAVAVSDQQGGRPLVAYGFVETNASGDDILRLETLSLCVVPPEAPACFSLSVNLDTGYAELDRYVGEPHVGEAIARNR